jgi:predicted dehydrogenase
MSERKVRVAIIGLGFGAEFIPIYQSHPNAEMAAICRRNKAELDACGDKFGIAKRYTDYDALLKDPDIDAIHINSPIPDHGPQTIKALKAGKHVACTVPMATEKDQIKEIVELQRKTGLVYTMMETVVYSREYLFVKDLYDRGVLGRVQFLRGSHVQDMDGWPDYWPGLPPMWYATHCVSPCLALLSSPGKSALAESVVCHGSGRIRESLIPKYNSSFAVESATFKIGGTDVVAEVTRSLFDCARQYRESFDVTASNVSFEWQQVEGEDPVLHMRGLPEHQIPRRVKVPDFAGRLPEGIRKFTGAIHDATHLSFVQGGGHGGSHPHLANQFLMAVLGKQLPFPDAPTSANWTLVGISAHESAVAGGTRVTIPQY